MPEGLRERVLEAVEADWIRFFEGTCGVRWAGRPRMRRAHGCGFHEDRHPSFSIFQGEDGHIRWKCHAGCGSGDIFDAYQRARNLPEGPEGFREALHELAKAYGIEQGEAPEDTPGVIRDQPPPVLAPGARESRIPAELEPVETYSYTDEAGEILYQVLRYEWEEDGERKKSFVQRRPVGDGWSYDLEGVRRVPYRLSELFAQTLIFLVEGEKKAELLRSWRIAATCVAGGAQAWRDEYAPYFSGKMVIILPDNDPPGEEFARRAGSSLAKVAKSVEVVRLPGLPPKGDIVDYAEAGHDRADFIADVKELREPLPAEEEPAPESTPEKAPESAQDRPEGGGDLEHVVAILRAGGAKKGRVAAAIRALQAEEEDEDEERVLIAWNPAPPERAGSIAFIERGPSTGLPSLDLLTNGLRPAWYVVEGDSGRGKSTFVAQIVSAAIRAGKPDPEDPDKRIPSPWLILPMEEDPAAWRVMVLARLSQVDGRLLATARWEAMNEAVRARVELAWEEFRETVAGMCWPSPDVYRIRIDTAMKMLAQFQEAVGGKEGAGVGGMVIDPVHRLARGPDQKEYDALEIATGRILEAVQRWKIPVITNVHLNAQGVAKGTTSFAFSGQVRIQLADDDTAQKANEHLTPEERSLQPYIHCIVAKNKNMPTGSFLLSYDKRHSTFREAGYE